MTLQEICLNGYGVLNSKKFKHDLLVNSSIETKAKIKFNSKTNLSSILYQNRNNNDRLVIKVLQRTSKMYWKIFFSTIYQFNLFQEFSLLFRIKRQRNSSIKHLSKYSIDTLRSWFIVIGLQEKNQLFSCSKILVERHWKKIKIKIHTFDLQEITRLKIVLFSVSDIGVDQEQELIIKTKEESQGKLNLNFNVGLL